MNKLDKYLSALEAAVDAKDRKAIELLDGFSAYVYQEIFAGAKGSSGEDSAAWDEMLKRIKAVISGMSQLTPSMWD